MIDPVSDLQNQVQAYLDGTLTEDALLTSVLAHMRPIVELHDQAAKDLVVEVWSILGDSSAGTISEEEAQSQLAARLATYRAAGSG